MTDRCTATPDEVERLGRPGRGQAAVRGHPVAAARRRSASTASRRAELDAEQVRLRPSALSHADRDALAAIVGADVLPRRRPRPAAARGRQVHPGPAAAQGHRRPGRARRGAAARRRRRGRRDPAATARSTASPSSRSAAAPAWSAGSIPIRGEFKAVVSLDLRRLDQLHALDEVSGEAELGAGVTGPEAERLLGEHGFSLGHFPQSFEFATIGGFAATRSSGQDSAGYGRFNDMVRGLRVVTPAGVLDLGRAPESAAGPDLRQLLIGSEGVFGVITRGAAAGAPGAGGHPLRGVVVPRLRHRRRRAARRHPDRHRPDRHPALRRGRDRRQPRHHREHRRAQHHRRLPGDHRVRGHRRRTPRAGTPKPGRCWRPRAARRWARARRAHGSTAGSARRTCATRCWRPARCARRSRPRPTGPTSPR